MSSSGRDTIIANKFKLQRKLGSGSFGEIFLAIHIDTHAEYAIKLEPIKATHPQLHYEAKVYKLMSGGVGIPNVYGFNVNSSHSFMVMERLGPSLEDLFNHCSRKFSMKTILLIAEQLLTRVEYFHERKCIHRDIKPDNILMGLNNNASTLYLIDYGLAKKYVDGRTGMHIKFRTDKSLTGTARYASINSHIGYEQGRRDDLEVIAYILIYFLKGQLPWQGLRGANKKQKYEAILNKKRETSPETLCSHLPKEFLAYLHYCRNLKFEDKPDYLRLKVIFRNLAKSLGYQYDGVFDWMDPKMRPMPRSRA